MHLPALDRGLSVCIFSKTNIPRRCSIHSARDAWPRRRLKPGFAGASAGSAVGLPSAVDADSLCSIVDVDSNCFTGTSKASNRTMRSPSLRDTISAALFLPTAFSSSSYTCLRFLARL
uniref:Uncharacterized protein n=1 Tax=Eutreptiella gymnastica TaxID=73025 RepID=A0A7S1NHU8_9EUGL